MFTDWTKDILQSEYRDKFIEQESWIIKKKINMVHKDSFQLISWTCLWDIFVAQKFNIFTVLKKILQNLLFCYCYDNYQCHFASLRYRCATSKKICFV